MAAVAVTEPDFGSDVAGIKVTATPAAGPDGEPGYVINGVKTWCTFGARADVLMLLARTDPDRTKTHRGLSLFIVPKPRGDGHGFEFDAGPPRRRRQRPARWRAAPIDTIGYRGMHTYEIALDNWWVPAENLVGERRRARARASTSRWPGFENGRLQTAARAVGVMQAAYEAALDYAHNRKVFGQPIIDYQLTQAKLGRMAVLIQAGRQFAYAVATLMAKGEGAIEAAMVKAYVCKAAEWVTREAMQIHGGMGYAEEYTGQPPVRRRPRAVASSRAPTRRCASRSSPADCATIDLTPLRRRRAVVDYWTMTLDHQGRFGGAQKPTRRGWRNDRLHRAHTDRPGHRLGLAFPAYFGELGRQRRRAVRRAQRPRRARSVHHRRSAHRQPRGPRQGRHRRKGPDDGGRR